MTQLNNGPETGGRSPEIIPLPSWHDLFTFLEPQEFVTVPKKYDLFMGLPLVASGASEDQIASTADLFKPSARSPYFQTFNGIGALDCSTPILEEDLRLTVQSLLGIADSVLIYIPPATPLAAKAYPACFENSILQAVKSLSGMKKVHILTDDLKAYGMGWRDFLYPTDRDDVSVIDPIHTNYQGARRFSEEFADRIAPLMRQGL